MGLPAEEWRAKQPWGEGDKGQPQRSEGTGGPPSQPSPFLPTGQVVKLHSKGCGSSCDDVYDMMEQLVEKMVSEDRSKLELWAPDCCGKDLCNRVAQVGRSLWILAGGLLLSLRPALLWALL